VVKQFEMETATMPPVPPTPSRPSIKLQEPVPGFFLLHHFAQKKLGIDPYTFLDDIQKIAPTRGATDKIVKGGLQVVDGANPDLKYRGNELRRCKIWAQDGPVSEGVRVYSYTGFTYPVAHATSDWNDCEMLKLPSEAMNEFIGGWDSTAPKMDHLIVTMYKDGSHNIGWHWDKDRSLAKNGWIAVLKLGPSARRFALRKRADKSKGEDQESMPVLFDELIEPGTLILMSLDTNLATQHSVPTSDDESTGLSGSIVWRSVEQVLSQEELGKKVGNTEKGRAKRKAEKEERASSSKGQKL
jgi:hypothetical protein